MLAIRSLLRTNPQLVKNAAQQRYMSAIGVPARKRVSKAEVAFLAAMMMSSWLVIPGWVLVNMKHYRAK